jgi:hypothetical protein
VSHESNERALAAYRHVILRSLGEVADRLRAVSNDAGQFTAQSAAASAAGRSFQI